MCRKCGHEFAWGASTKCEAPLARGRASLGDVDGTLENIPMPEGRQEMLERLFGPRGEKK